MTGLEPEHQTILEIGTLVTDSALAVVAEGPSFVIHQPESVLEAMDPWCINQHGLSGLTQKSRESKISLGAAEQLTLEFLQKHCAPKSSPLCGNSIGQDRRFLIKYMPTLNVFFHYRNIDVSTIKELCKRWYPKTCQAPTKKSTHQVLDDIRESIEELQHYRRTIFK